MRAFIQKLCDTIAIFVGAIVVFTIFMGIFVLIVQFVKFAWNL